MNFQRLLASGTALCFAAALAGCGGNSPTESNTGSTNSGSTNSASTESNSASGTTTAASGSGLTGSGSTFIFPIMTQWAKQYKDAKGVQVDYQGEGSGAGIKHLTAGTVDFAASDAPMNAKEKAAMPSPAVTMPAVAGAVVVAYNLPSAPKDLKMTGQILSDIYMGKITKWNDAAIGGINPGVKLPSTPITVAHRSDGSGTSFIFTNFLAAASTEWKTKVGASKAPTWPVGVGGKGNDGVAATVKQSPGGIGYVELAYAKKGGLSYASVQNKAGQFIEPTVESTTAAAEGAASALAADNTAPIANSAGAKAYPIAGFSYLMVYGSAKNAGTGAQLKEFLKYVMTDGQKSAAGLDYAPLPKAVADMNLKAIDALK